MVPRIPSRKIKKIFLTNRKTRVQQTCRHRLVDVTQENRKRRFSHVFPFIVVFCFDPIFHRCRVATLKREKGFPERQWLPANPSPSLSPPPTLAALQAAP
jgi:hypothetical protein